MAKRNCGKAQKQGEEGVRIQYHSLNKQVSGQLERKEGMKGGSANESQILKMLIYGEKEKVFLDHFRNAV